MNKVNIVAAIASKTGIVLYLDTGKELNLPNDHWRTKAILDQTLDKLARKKVVTIDLDEYSVEARIEQKSKGFIRFMREKISAVGEYFGLISTNQEPLKATTNLTPIAETETLVAVVNGVKIPGMEKIERQLDVAAFTGNTIGLERFLERLSKVIDERGHSVQELLNFMKRADLPIADDGSIVAYKVLKTGAEGFIVDCHSGNVRQRLGSYVYMDEKLVDPSRRTECSTGLHVARRGYLNGFRGDVITLIKIAPEAVIAVPHNEPDKMRVAGYHIVAMLPPRVHELLRANKPMTSDEAAARILAAVVVGDHVQILERVKIGAAYGGNVTITLEEGVVEVEHVAKEIAGVKALDDEEEKTFKANVHDVRAAVAEAAAETAGAPGSEPEEDWEVDPDWENDDELTDEEFVDQEAEAIEAADAELDQIESATTDEDAQQFLAQEAAASGDLSAAISEPKPEFKPEPKSKPKKSKSKKKLNGLDHIPEKYRQAYAEVLEGKISQREAEKLYHVSAKKLRALLRENGLL